MSFFQYLARRQPLPQSPYHTLQERLRGMTLSFFTQSSERGDLGIKPGVFDDMRSSPIEWSLTGSNYVP